MGDWSIQYGGNALVPTAKPKRQSRATPWSTAKSKCRRTCHGSRSEKVHGTLWRTRSLSRLNATRAIGPRMVGGYVGTLCHQKPRAQE